MDNKNERNEVHSAIWKIANGLRGSVDGWEFKNYVLIMIFYRYISENITNYINEGEWECGHLDFDYSKIADDDANSLKEEIVNEKGYFILPSQLFNNVYKNNNSNENLNITLNNIFSSIKQSSIGSHSEGNISGLFDDFDINNRKLGETVFEKNKLLKKLMIGIAEMKLGNFTDNSIDAFGDAYEYLMSMYASNAGKSGGEFFTPQEVSELLVQLVINGKDKIRKVYDPACGSGSLLLKFSKIMSLNKHIEYYGQEINITTYNLCRMNMFLHNIEFDKFKIEHGNTLINPKHHEIKVDAVVSNPPYSTKWEGDNNSLLSNDERFSSAGVLAPKSKADFAFVLDALYHLENDGVAAIVCFPGIFYRGGAEQKIRKYLIDYNFVDAIIQLPINLFYGTSIQTYIMILKKNRKDQPILFIDASNQYEKINNNNRLNKDNINFIINLYKERIEEKYISSLVHRSDIELNNYSLNVNTYIESEDKSENIDINVLNQRISQVAEKNDLLRKEIKNIIKVIENE
ncbi:MAG: type I restriction-modification system subunit M [Mycoplasmoidaceae bacterium]